MTINTAELRLVLKEIETHPETWDQSVWAHRAACGMRFCFAGHVVARSFEYKIVWDDELAFSCRGRHGRFVPIRDAARRILGLDDDQADMLFRPNNSLADLRRIVEGLCAEAEEEETA